jgi:glyoxylase-like metal-dependent hydrolase (beta-lactamase superfamily II)
MLRVRSVQGNRQKLDGGAMFGNVPRALWSRWCAPDERGCIELATRALLVEDGRRRVLLEAGIGIFFEPKLRDRYGVFEPDHVLLASLAALGLGDEDIDVVVLSHLHFDHVGGLLSGYQANTRPRLLFPNARYVTSRTTYQRAAHPHLRDRASFIPEVPELLEQSGRLVLIQAAEPPSGILDERYRFSETEGHTPGMLHTEIVGQAQAILCCADLVPGIPWLHLPVTMGYDRCAEKVVDEKARMLQAAQQQQRWLFFTHDPHTALARVQRDAEGRFTAVRRLNDAEADLDLDGAD